MDTLAIVLVAIGVICCAGGVLLLARALGVANERIRRLERMTS